MTEVAHRAARPRPPVLRALGAAEPPDAVEVSGEPYRLVRVFKHDSWAATALYAGAARQVVCKFNRVQPVGPVPMHWLGRVLARREAALLRRLAGLPHVPRWAGDVRVNGRVQQHAVAHDFIPGHPLGDRESVGDHFFPALRAALAALHRRGVAYVDLHKRENILVGDDGQPYLIDFQIGLARPAWWPANHEAVEAVLRLAQANDVYHLAKHVARCRPDQAATPELPWSIRLHRLVGRPFRALRRRLLVRAGVRTGRGRVTTEHFPEEAVRAA
ncbi:MAG TPA: hypothetical protein VGF55_29455 [Gemmataceae bacterium]|jgi:hypothetical protein